MARNARKRKASGALPRSADFQPSRRAREVAAVYLNAIQADGRVNLVEAWSIRPGDDGDGNSICESIGDYRSAHVRDLWLERQALEAEKRKATPHQQNDG